jgi:DNA-directed RNA polymerase specialized sigma24 family protein
MSSRLEVILTELQEVDVLALDEASRSLESLDPGHYWIVGLRIFGGLSIEEVAEVMGISASTVKREWALARSWLFRELSK